MRSADHRRPDSRRERLLRVDPRSGAFQEGRVADLPAHVREGDLLVVNEAATLPASLRARLVRAFPGGSVPRRITPADAILLELRLAGASAREGDWWAVLFGEGNWRTPTEHRTPPPLVAPGDRLVIARDFEAEVEEISALSPRLVRLAFDLSGKAFYQAIYRYGRPVQYSYLQNDLALWDVQTAYGTRPWAMEMPSAGRPLTWDLLLELRRRGVSIARVTHAAGLSATGEPRLDAALPLPERFLIPEGTVRAIGEARRTGGRVVAIGTSTVRALEGAAAANRGRLVPGEGTTDLVLGPGTQLRVVDGLMTGIHEAGSSHLALVESFISPFLLGPALDYAERHGFRQHEFGDSMLILPDSAAADLGRGRDVDRQSRQNRA